MFFTDFPQGFGVKSLHLGGGGALMAFLVPFYKGVFAKVL